MGTIRRAVACRVGVVIGIEDGDRLDRTGLRHGRDGGGEPVGGLNVCRVWPDGVVLPQPSPGFWPGPLPGPLPGVAPGPCEPCQLTDGSRSRMAPQWATPGAAEGRQTGANSDAAEELAPGDGGGGYGNA